MNKIAYTLTISSFWANMHPREQLVAEIYKIKGFSKEGGIKVGENFRDSFICLNDRLA